MRKIALLLILGFSTLLVKAGDWTFGERETGQYVASVEEGKFINPFSKNNKLKSLVLFNLDTTSNLALYITLFEYGEYIVADNPSQNCAAEVIIDGQKTLYKIDHASNKQDLKFGKAATNRIAAALHEGQDVQLKIVIDTNSYQFKIQSEGFSEEFSNWISA